MARTSASRLRRAERRRLKRRIHKTNTASLQSSLGAQAALERSRKKLADAVSERDKVKAGEARCRSRYEERVESLMTFKVFKLDSVEQLKFLLRIKRKNRGFRFGVVITGPESAEIEKLANFHEIHQTTEDDEEYE